MEKTEADDSPRKDTTSIFVSDQVPHVAGEMEADLGQKPWVAEGDLACAEKAPCAAPADLAGGPDARFTACGR